MVSHAFIYHWVPILICLKQDNGNAMRGGKAVIRFQEQLCHLLFACHILIHKLISLCLSLSLSHTVHWKQRKPRSQRVSLLFFHWLQRAPLWNTEFLSLASIVPHSPFLKEQRDSDVLPYSWRESSETHKQPYTQMCTCNCVYSHPVPLRASSVRSCDTQSRPKPPSGLYTTI